MPVCRQAFTLIEIMLVVVVIGVVATIAGPRIIRRPPSAKWENVVEEVNNLVAYARQEAIANHKIYRLHFRVSRGESSIQVELEGRDKEKPERKVYTTVKSYYFDPKYSFPEPITLEAVYHAKKNELEEQGQHAYCYVIPNGLVQMTRVHLENKNNKVQPKVTFEMQPFFGTFVIREGFVRDR